MIAVIKEDETIFTLINTFEVDPPNALLIVESLRDFTENFTRGLPGFVSASVHVALDQRRVVNYVQWSSQLELEAMLSRPEAIRHLAEIKQLARQITPVFYRVAWVG